MWFCIKPQIYNASAPDTCVCANVHAVHCARYTLHIVHIVHMVHMLHMVHMVHVLLKSWNPPLHWQGDQGLTPEPVLKINIWMQISNHVLPNKIPTFDTSCFNYVVFRYWRVAWLVDPDLKIYISRTALQILPSPIGRNTYIVWSMIETVIN